MDWNRQNLIAFGDLTIKGKDSKGQEIIVEAPIEKLVIEVEDNDDDFFWNSKEVTFISTLAEGCNYTINAVKPQSVERTARVEVGRYGEEEVIPSMTLNGVKKAASIAGVDDNTAFDVVFENDRERCITKVFIVFEWID